MFNNWKQRLLSSWTFMRFIRLGLALVVLSEAWKNSEILFGLLGGILLFQSLFNYGCCGVNGCDVNQSNSKLKLSPDALNETTFKEIK